MFSRSYILIKMALIISGLIFVFFAGIPLYTFATYSGELGDKEYIMNRNNSGLILLDRDGQPFFTFYQAKTSVYIPLEDIPVYLQKAVIATEDKNFYTNPGFSVRGMARAAYANMRAGKIVQGGSTITQELVKNELLSPKKSYLRKFQEVTLAYVLNRQYSKDDILEMYLNSAYFGEGAFGVENAAQVYFGKEEKDLTLAESALLAGLLPAPSSYSPLTNDPAIARKRKDLVVNIMFEDGLITKDEAESALIEEVTFNSQKDDINVLAPHYALQVRDLLVKEYGEEYVVRSGFKVRTTLNRSWQEHAQSVVTREVSKLAKNNATNGSAVAVDPKTGEVLVMVGSVDWSNSTFGKVNMALTPRQPGSAYKPLIYSIALEERLITPATILNDSPTTFQRNYKPRNYDGKFRGPVTVRRALANSLNVPAVAVMDKVGIKKGLESAKRFGITTLGDKTSDYGLSLVLGSGEVSLVELTNAYSTFANNGKRNDLQYIIEIKDKFDKTVKANGNRSTQVIGSDTAYLISSILSDRSARAEMFGGALNINKNAAVKTGTTQNYRGALTVGYTPSLAVGVWVGNNDNAAMDRVAGSLGAAPVWKLMMQEYLEGRPNEEFFKPDSIEQITICHVTGDEENRSVRSYTEYVIRGTAQNVPCPKIEPKEGTEENKEGEENKTPDEPPPEPEPPKPGNPNPPGQDNND